MSGWPSCARLYRTFALASLVGWAALSCRREPAYQQALEQGNALIEEDPQAALAEFERAAQLGAKAEGNAGLGRALEELGRLDEALRHLELARTEAPANPSLTLAVARIQLLLGREAEGKRQLERVLEQAPQELPAALLLGVLARSGPEAARARAHIDRWAAQQAQHGHTERWLEVEAVLRELDVLERRAPRPSANRGRLLNAKLGRELAQIFARTGRPRTAREVLTAVREQHPEDGAAWSRSVELELTLGNLEAARRIIERAPQVERATTGMIELEARLARRQGAHRRSATLFSRAAAAAAPSGTLRRQALQLAEAEELLAADAPGEAESTLRRALAQAPAFTPARLALAGILSRSGRHEEAKSEAERAVAADKKHAGARDVLISVLVAAGQNEAAEHACASYAEAFPALAGPRIMQALLLGKRDPAKSEQLLERALEIDPSSARAIAALGELPGGELRLERHAERSRSWLAYLKLGELREKRKDRAAAERAYLRATEVAAGRAEPWSRIGAFYADSGDRERALRATERWTSAVPSSESAWNRRAELERSLGRHAEALRSYERCLELNPGFVPALNNAAMLLLGPLHDPERAVELAQRARSEAPGLPALADTLGWALFRRGRKADLAQARELLIRAAPALDSAEAYYHLGAVLLAAGSPDSATALERAVRDGSGYAALDDARRLLAEARVVAAAHAAEAPEATQSSL